MVGKRPEIPDVPSLKQRHAVFLRKPFLVQHFVGYSFEILIQSECRQDGQ